MRIAGRRQAAAPLLAARLGRAPAPDGAGRGDFVTAYERPQTADYREFYDELRRERFLESVADELNRVLALPAAVEFYAAALEEPDSALEYLESHGVDRARLESVACLLYGNAPGNHGQSLARNIVPAELAPRCAEELVAVAKAWGLALKDHGRAPAAVPPAARQRRPLSRRPAGA